MTELTVFTTLQGVGCKTCCEVKLGLFQPGNQWKFQEIQSIILTQIQMINQKKYKSNTNSSCTSEEIPKSLSNHRRRRLSTSCCQRCGTLSRRKATRRLLLPSWKRSGAPTTTSTRCLWRCWPSSWTPTSSRACQRPRPKRDWRGTAPTP